jgi:hypothetical protein
LDQPVQLGVQIGVERLDGFVHAVGELDGAGWLRSERAAA